MEANYQYSGPETDGHQQPDILQPQGDDFADEYHQHHHHHHQHHHHQQDGEEVAVQQQEQQQQQQQQEQSIEQATGPTLLTVDTTSVKQTQGIQPTSSFHSVSSIDSSAEMSRYFPDAQTPSLSPFRHHQEVEDGTQSTAASSGGVTTTTINAGPYVSAPAPTAAAPQLQQPVRPPIMAQQQAQSQPAGRPLPGIPSYSSQIEGLSVSQALVNDILVDLQSKVINESLHQFGSDSSSENYLEPLPPIYIRAPQPTIILRSDLNRLRAELGNRVRPPVVYRHPGGAHQQQQQQQQFHQFQQNNFQAPRFPAPPQAHLPPDFYKEFRHPTVVNSDEYQTMSTGEEHRDENDERLVHQIDNVNDIHRPLGDFQGLSAAASLNRYASPSQFSSFNLNDLLVEQKGDNDIGLTSSSLNIDNDNMFSRPGRPRQEISYDLNDCILRCFEAHRQRVLRRRAARQARKTRRRQSQEQQQQQQQQQQPTSFHSDHYQTYAPSSSYIDQYPRHFQTQPIGEYQSTSYDFTQPTQPPLDNYFTTTGSPIDYSSISRADDQSVYVSTPYDTSFTGPTTTTSTTYAKPGAFEYTREEYTSTSQPTEVPTDYYQQQQQQIPTQETYAQTNAFDYTTESHLPTYNFENIQQESTQYPLRTEDVPQQSSFDYATVATTAYPSSEIDMRANEYRQTFDYHQQETPFQSSQIHDTLLGNQQFIGAGVPTGTFEYSRESYYSQEPLPSEYPIETTTIEQTQQQQQQYSSLPTFDYSTSQDATQIHFDQPAISSQQKLFNVNDYIQQYESQQQQQQQRSTAPFDIQQYLPTQVTEGDQTTRQIYDLQNYTNEPLVPAQTLHEEEDHHRLLHHQTVVDDRIKTEPSTYNTISSLPSLPIAEQITQQQESITTDFPSPPTPDYRTYQTSDQRPGRSLTSIIPSGDKPTIYTPPSPPLPPSESDDDKNEDEEIFDLRACIARCYAKHQAQWNQEEQQRYTQQFIQQSTAILAVSCDDKNRPIDTWKQDVQEHTFEQIPPTTSSTFEADTSGQQTIEYSPPIVTQTRQILPSLPYDDWKASEQQQQQQPYDYTFPSSPHLTFKETDRQPPVQYQNIPVEQQQQQRYRAYSEPSLTQPTTATVILPPPISVAEQIPRRAISIPMIHRRQQAGTAPVHLLNNGRSYEVDSAATRRFPLIDPKTGLCLVPCPETRKYAHLPPHLRPELFCVELPPPGSLPPVPPPLPPPPIQQQQQQQQQRWCIKCCCRPHLIKKIVFKRVGEDHAESSAEHLDYASVIDQLGTRISVRYGNDLMQEGEAFVSGGYNEQLRIIDFPVYISGKEDPTLTPLIPVN